MDYFVAALRHPLPVGPLQQTKAEQSTLRDFVAALRHPSPPERKKWRSSKLDAIFSAHLRRVRDSNPRTR